MSSLMKTNFFFTYTISGFVLTSRRYCLVIGRMTCRYRIRNIIAKTTHDRHLHDSLKSTSSLTIMSTCIRRKRTCYEYPLSLRMITCVLIHIFIILILPSSPIFHGHTCSSSHRHNHHRWVCSVSRGILDSDLIPGRVFFDRREELAAGCVDAVEVDGFFWRGG